MLDWNAKSRRKLFPSKSDILPEQSRLKKRCDGNVSMARLQILDEDESIKGSSDYSSASSVIDEDICGTRAPGVVARLMGLDSLPESNVSDPCWIPCFDSQENGRAPKYQKVIHKFQAEVLPPTSARLIPITRHKLLSPVKSANFVPSKNAYRIAKVAARIIEPRSAKMKLHTGGSFTCSAPLKVQDLKEKVKQRRDESRVVKNVKGPFMNPEVKNKGKSISLALLAKANVQKREGIIRLRNPVNLEEQPCEVSPKSKDQSTTQKSMIKKQSSVLCQNNQKQNCIIDRRKLSKCSSNSVKPNAGKSSGAANVSLRNLSGEVSSSNRLDKSKTSRNIRMDKSGKDVRSSNWDKDSGKTGTDVVSFTFTAPLTRSSPNSSAQVKEVMKGSDALSILLEQKLKELADKVEFSVSHDIGHGWKGVMKSAVQDGNMSDDDLVLEDITLNRSKKSPVEYVKEMVCNIETTFMNYVLGRTDPNIFNKKRGSNNSQRQLMFDVVCECLHVRCTRYACGGFELWRKGVSMVRQKERLAEQVYREIWDWSGVGDCMIDELVDQDMSKWYGKWVEFQTEFFQVGVEIEGSVLNSLVHEMVADMLAVTMDMFSC